MDRFPLPNIDQLVDETAGCELMSFMDAFHGYHQISMHEEDAEKTAFTTPEGIFCYLVMPFGLKNARATYTRMVAKLFKTVLGRNMEAYVDDMIVKSRKATSHVEDLGEVFSIMKKFNLRLNQKKCTFTVDGGKFLGIMVTRNGIEPNPEKNKGFEWTPHCQKAFEELKKYLLSPPLLAKPEAGEALILYLGMSQGAISSVLVKEEGGTQRPIYYMSKALHDAELRYSVLEKTVFAIVTSSKRLAHYFQAHPLHVLSHQPLGSFFRNTNSSARMARWIMHLSQFDIDFKPRPDIKGKALADFIVECTAREVTDQVETKDGGWWTLSTDGSSNSKGCGGDVVLVTLEGFHAYYAIRFHFKLSNNEAEYVALLNGLRLAAGLRAEKVRIRCDSKLVVSQVSGEYEANEGNMQKYKGTVLRTLREFEGYEIHQVPREQNADADMLSKLSTGVPSHIRKIARLEDLETSSIEVSWVFPVQTREPCWIDHIKRYKADGTLPQDEADAKVTKLRAPSYVVSGDKLYKRSYNGTLLRCLYPDEAKLVMKEVHEGAALFAELCVMPVFFNSVGGIARAWGLSAILYRRQAAIRTHPMVLKHMTSAAVADVVPVALAVDVRSPNLTCYLQVVRYPECREAMDLEFNALQYNNTWRLVPYHPNMNVVGCKWDFFDTFSPVVKPTTVRLLLALAVSSNWVIRQLDVHNAFLNGNLPETVYMRQLLGYADANCPEHAASHVYLLVYVANILVMGSPSFFLGIEIVARDSGCVLSQKWYMCDILKCTGMVDYDLFAYLTKYKSLAGALQYLTTRVGCPVDRKSTSGFAVFLGCVSTEVTWIICLCCVASGELLVKSISIKELVADIFTKPLLAFRFVFFVISFRLSAMTPTLEGDC
ncbi:PREDICTED: uncharacterized protein LOC109162738 [Ipomoea nil]|uniref:uncharacterized protein LOC109162738 n=1 Tax=Ipomoea nil TaxID=35883 RepID=UPI000900C30C|nr:PREDICTED: uncharacterized protein LOC109162738 [Ipomoea nil]